MLYPMPGEPLVRGGVRGTWEYVFDTDDHKPKYLHRECDAVAEDGRCIMCGAPSPTLWTSPAPADR